jgi:hypothetical protein
VLTGPNKDEVRLRGGPGEIYSPDFSFAVISFGGAPIFELHQGVKVMGVSGVAHECDVSAIHAGRAGWRRSQHTRPGAVDLFFALEAKAYNTTLVDLGTARNFGRASQRTSSSRGSSWEQPPLSTRAPDSSYRVGRLARTLT